MDPAFGFETDLQSWTHVQNSYVLPNYPPTGLPPVADPQTGFPQMGYPQPGVPPVAFMGYPSTAFPQTTLHRPNADSSSQAAPKKLSAADITNRNIMMLNETMRLTQGIPQVPRTYKDRVQLTVALHLYLETSPGPLLDENTIAHVVYNQPCGKPWQPPAEGLLAHMNSNPNETVGRWYAEVINDRKCWTKKAMGAYAAWQGFCEALGRGPPVAFKGRWW